MEPLESRAATDDEAEGLSLKREDPIAKKTLLLLPWCACVLPQTPDPHTNPHARPAPISSIRLTPINPLPPQAPRPLRAPCRPSAPDTHRTSTLPPPFKPPLPCRRCWPG